MFLDKGKILTELNALYQQQTALSASLYAYPGMGKTRLLKELSQGKTVLYFKASAVSFEENFRLLKNLCIRRLGQEYETAKKFTELFKKLSKAAAQSPLLLILDDFPHWTSKNRRFSTQLASCIQKSKAANAPLMVLLCKPGELYEKEHDKEDLRFFLRPFHFFEMQKLFPDMETEEQILLYSITKGCPGYLKYFSCGSSVKETLCKLFFTEDGVFYRLVSSRIREYYSASPIMGGILSSFGGEYKKLQEICDYTQLTPSAASSLLTSLGAHNLVSRMIPVTEDQGSRRAFYLISDSIFCFWYTYVLPFRSEIETGAGETVFHTVVSPALDSYIKTGFEDICRDFLKLQAEAGLAPFKMEKIGRWWGQHPTKKRTEYVSIAAASENHILLGACFWTDEWIDVDALQELQKHAGLFPEREQYYCLFSKSEFVSGFEIISGSHVHVYSLEEMCRIAKGLC